MPMRVLTKSVLLFGTSIGPFPSQILILLGPVESWGRPVLMRQRLELRSEL